MKLEFGGGEIDALLDIRTGHLTLATEKEQIRSYGGNPYYTSHSGLSGASWLPDRPHFRKLKTYRTDTNQLRFPVEKNDGDIFIPIIFQEKKIDDNYPVAIRESSLECILVQHATDLLKVLVLREKGEIYTEDRGIKKIRGSIASDELPELDQDRQQLEMSVWREHGSLHTVVFNFWYFGDEPDKLAQKRRERTIKFLFHEELDFTLRLGQNGPKYENALNFWERLGLFPVQGENDDDRFYKVVDGICEHVYQDLESVEALEAVSPQNVSFLNRDVYVQRDKKTGYSYLVARWVSEEGWQYDYEIGLGFNSELLLLSGNREGIVVEAIIAARQKYLNRTASKETLEAFCQKHPDHPVSISHSVAAGNCRIGTVKWCRENISKLPVGLIEQSETQDECDYVPIVTLGELVKYLGKAEVRRVIAHILDTAGPYLTD
jgi:hypothetical protein